MSTHNRRPVTQGGQGGQGGSGGSGAPGGSGGVPKSHGPGGRGSMRAPKVASFWGQADVAAEPAAPIKPGPDPTALVSSLGPPPLANQENAAVHYFAAVYAKAVGSAGALAAAAGLLAADDDDDDDEDETNVASEAGNAGDNNQARK